MDIRLAKASDMPLMQEINSFNLPENYYMKYYMYHLISWPHLSYVAVDVSRPPKTPYDYPKIVGFVMAKMEEEPEDGIPHGHITSLSVLRTHRRLGIAEKLMRQTQMALVEAYQARYVILHVRLSNKAGYGLYKEKLGYSMQRIVKNYYDQEDAYYMRLDFKKLLDRVAAGRPLGYKYSSGDVKDDDSSDNDSDSEDESPTKATETSTEKSSPPVADEEALQTLGEDEGDAVGNLDKKDILKDIENATKRLALKSEN